MTYRARRFLFPPCRDSSTVVGAPIETYCVAGDASQISLDPEQVHARTGVELSNPI
jgi:hypothetical protein